MELERVEQSLSISAWPIKQWIAQYIPELWLQAVVGLVFLLAVFFILRQLSLVLLRSIFKNALLRMGKRHWLTAVSTYKARESLSTAVPLLITATGLNLIPVNQQLQDALSRLIFAVALFYLFKMVAALLRSWEHVQDHQPDSLKGSIKGYIQLIRLACWCIAAIVIISILVNKSPMLMISGLGALSAVLLLVFKDTLLSVVASSQMNSNDMLRVGDWIEMPQAGADGYVIDMALHTVKVQNWDKTVTTIPTYQLFSQSYKNWRHMFESGGRRIKRSLRIDANSVRFLTEKDVVKLRRFELLEEYLTDKTRVLAAANQAVDMVDPVNHRRLTNLGTFRAYADAYIKHKKGVHPEMLRMVRMMEPTAEGIPIEVYCFSADTAWINYEQLQGDIFDHLLAILPEMDLHLYQAPSGSDLRGAFIDAAATERLKEQLKQS